MERLIEIGLVKSIGVSNFNSQQLDDILNKAKVGMVPSTYSVSIRIGVYEPNHVLRKDLPPMVGTHNLSFNNILYFVHQEHG